MKNLRDGEPCDHPGCLNHVSHPCEGCGRIAGVFHPHYPDDFNKHEKAVDVSNDEINSMIRECVVELENDFDRADVEISTGNASVRAERYMDYYKITVAKNYFDVEIPR